MHDQYHTTCASLNICFVTGETSASLHQLCLRIVGPVLSLAHPPSFCPALQKFHCSSAVWLGFSPAHSHCIHLWNLPRLCRPALLTWAPPRMNRTFASALYSESASSVVSGSLAAAG
ncbi:hypothetical protein IG631_18641 [Alternaria alternata]|nr:hypothetical protein IG631_18641 [Alternaria alternata]